MDRDAILSSLIALLVDQGITMPINEHHAICGDLGVCGGDFQEFMASAWQAVGLPQDGTVYLDVPEASITVGDVIEAIGKAQAG